MITFTSAYQGLLALTALLPLVHAEGCYTGGLTWQELHGNPSNADIQAKNLDMSAELQKDIEYICTQLADTNWEKDGLPWTDCTNWPVTYARGEGEDCRPWNGGHHLSECQGGNIGDTNHVAWEIKYHGSETKQMTKKMCLEGWAESIKCDHGGELNKDGYWW